MWCFLRASGIFRKLVFGIPKLRCGLTGLILGLPQLKTCSKPRVFTRFHRFRIKPKFVCSWLMFQKRCEKHAFSRVFQASGPRFHVSFFIVFARSSKTFWKHGAQFGSPEAHFRHFLSLGAASTASFWGFGGPLPLFPTHFCNKIRKRLAHFLRFLTDMPQATCFHIFLMISPWISLSAFQALARKCSFWSFQKYYSKFPKPSMAQKYRFWAIWSYFSIFPEPYVGRNILLRLPCKTHLKVCIQRQMTRLIFGISWALAQR